MKLLDLIYAIPIILIVLSIVTYEKPGPFD